MLNNKLEQQPDFIYNDEGKIVGYKTKAGADTEFPFSELLKSQSARFVANGTVVNVEKDRYYVYVSFDITFHSNPSPNYPSVSGGNIISGGNKWFNMYVSAHASGGNIYEHGLSIYVIKTETAKLGFGYVPYGGILLRLT